MQARKPHKKKMLFLLTPSQLSLTHTHKQANKKIFILFLCFYCFVQQDIHTLTLHHTHTPSCKPTHTPQHITTTTTTTTTKKKKKQGWTKHNMKSVCALEGAKAAAFVPQKQTAATELGRVHVASAAGGCYIWSQQSPAPATAIVINK